MKRKKQKNLMHIGNILEGSVSRFRTGSDGEIARIWSLWQSAVGDLIAQNTRPASFRGSLLTINVSSSAWLHHLTFLKPELITKVNQALGGELIKELRFKIGNINPLV